MMFRLDDETARSKREAFLDTQRRYALDARIAKAEDPNVYSERIANGGGAKKRKGTLCLRAGVAFEEARLLALAHPKKRVALLNPGNAERPATVLWDEDAGLEARFCSCSTLYPTLCHDSVWEGFYKFHIADCGRNEAATNRCIYSPAVTIFKTEVDGIPQMLPEEEWATVDVITCAPPHYRSEDSYSETELFAIHFLRGKNICDIAVQNEADILVLPAFGCEEERGNPPAIVAKAYTELMKQYRKHFFHVTFAMQGRCAEVDVLSAVFQETFRSCRLPVKRAKTNTSAKNLLHSYPIRPMESEYSYLHRVKHNLPYEKMEQVLPKQPAESEIDYRIRLIEKGDWNLVGVDVLNEREMEAVNNAVENLYYWAEVAAPFEGNDYIGYFLDLTDRIIGINIEPDTAHGGVVFGILRDHVVFSAEIVSIREEKDEWHECERMAAFYFRQDELEEKMVERGEKHPTDAESDKIVLPSEACRKARVLKNRLTEGAFSADLAEFSKYVQYIAGWELLHSVSNHYRGAIQYLTDKHDEAIVCVMVLLEDTAGQYAYTQMAFHGYVRPRPISDAPYCVKKDMF